MLNLFNQSVVDAAVRSSHARGGSDVRQINGRADAGDGWSRVGPRDFNPFTETPVDGRELALELRDRCEPLSRTRVRARSVSTWVCGS